MWLGELNYLGPTAYLGEGPNVGPEPVGVATVVRFRDLVLRSDIYAGEGLMLGMLDGWEELPPAREQWTDRPGQHGTFDAPVFSGSRTVVATGTCFVRESAVTDLRAMRRAMTFAEHPELIVIEHAGERLTVAGRLTKFRAAQDMWHQGAFTWAAEWVCPDPYRYGDQRARYTTLPELTGGLEFDLFDQNGFLEFGEAGSSGRVSLTNDGDADAWPVFEIRGPAPDGVTLQEVGTGRRIVTTTNVPQGSTLLINSANGVATLDGVDRSGQVTVREWTPVPPGGESTWFFSAPEFSAASLTAWVRDTWW